MQPTLLLDAIQNLANLVSNQQPNPYWGIEEKSFITLPLPWTIAQLLDEEDPNIQ